jgi:hypothetical protein
LPIGVSNMGEVERVLHLTAARFQLGQPLP